MYAISVLYFGTFKWTAKRLQVSCSAELIEENKIMKADLCMTDCKHSLSVILINKNFKQFTYRVVGAHAKGTGWWKKVSLPTQHRIRHSWDVPGTSFPMITQNNFFWNTSRHTVAYSSPTSGYSKYPRNETNFFHFLFPYYSSPSYFFMENLGLQFIETVTVINTLQTKSRLLSFYLLPQLQSKKLQENIKNTLLRRMILQRSSLMLVSDFKGNTLRAFMETA